MNNSNCECCPNGKAIAAMATAIAAALSDNLTIDEQNIIGNLLTQIGDVMLSIAAIDQTCQQNNSNSQTFVG